MGMCTSMGMMMSSCWGHDGEGTVEGLEERLRTIAQEEEDPENIMQKQ